MREKIQRQHNGQDSGHASSNSHSPAHCAMEMSYTTVQPGSGPSLNGSVVINGTTYTQSSANGTPSLSNGYLNPDVIPTTSQLPESVESVQNRLNSSNATELLHNSDETEIVNSNSTASNQQLQKNRYKQKHENLI